MGKDSKELAADITIAWLTVLSEKTGSTTIPASTVCTAFDEIYKQIRVSVRGDKKDTA